MAANMWRNSLKNVESDSNKILYETLLDFLQQNGTYFLNKSRITLFCLHSQESLYIWRKLLISSADVSIHMLLLC
jgi:hypothetical protein